MKDLSKITFHGFLGKKLRKRQWNLSVKSVSEAFRAINVLTRNQLSKTMEAHNPGVQRYKIVVNGKTLENDHHDLEQTPDKIEVTNLNLRRKIKTIDVVPIIEGSDFLDVFMAILGVVLIAASFGAFGAVGVWAAPLFFAGAGLLAAGVSNLLSKPPDTGDIEETNESYLFAGPTNVVGEGRAIPLPYGTLRVGTQRVAASFEVTYQSDDVATEVIKSNVC